ncbi:hypothetical protein [Thermus sp.]|uniref:hypothetical protein n=1 Tax=Thermus sp. TaxID=275 RepID=UPI0025EAFEF0|nr:hypothetical protein [Thermus sp.]MCS6867203.1 putative glycoside hydrolase family 15 protein [Thermus sp.]
MRGYSRALWTLFLLLAACGGGSPPRASEMVETTPFVRTALILYGSFAPTQPTTIRRTNGDTVGCYPIRNAARFHYLQITPGTHGWDRWCEVGQGQVGNAFEALKQANPGMRIYLYYNGAGVAVGMLGRSPPSYEDGELRWVLQNHGQGSPERWIALGRRTGEYLRDRRWGALWGFMDLGNPNWRRHWIRSRHERAWVRREGGHDGRFTDGIFVDDMEWTASARIPHLIPASQFDEASYRPRPDAQPDAPDFYTELRGGSLVHRNDLWQQHYTLWLDEAVPYFRARGLGFALNPWRVHDPAQRALYDRHGLLVFEECGFVCQYEMSVEHWEYKLGLFADPGRRFRIVTGNLVPDTSAPSGLHVPEEGLARMDRSYRGRTGWQWLWFALGSYWLGYSPEREDHFMFSAWGYRDGYWFEEYDPALLHLGRPLGPAVRAEAGLWWRPFERGFVAVNANRDPRTLRIPGGGQARLLAHENFRTPGQAPRVSLDAGVELAGHEGTILLRE